MDDFNLTDLNTHGGNINRFSKESGLPIDCIIDFSANINPLKLFSVQYLRCFGCGCSCISWRGKIIRKVANDNLYLYL